MAEAAVPRGRFGMSLRVASFAIAGETFVGRIGEPGDINGQHLLTGQGPMIDVRFTAK